MSDMDNIKIKLLNIEKEFNILKKKINKFHILYIILYFSPPILAIIILDNYFQEYYKIQTKIILFSIIILGLIIHYFLRHKYHKSRTRYKKFIIERINFLKKNFDNEKEFKNKLIKSINEIFDERGIEFNNIEINNSAFFNLIFVYLGLEID